MHPTEPSVEKPVCSARDAQPGMTGRARGPQPDGDVQLAQAGEHVVGVLGTDVGEDVAQVVTRAEQLALDVGAVLSELPVDGREHAGDVAVQMGQPVRTRRARQRDPRQVDAQRVRGAAVKGVMDGLLVPGQGLGKSGELGDAAPMRPGGYAPGEGLALLALDLECLADLFLPANRPSAATRVKPREATCQADEMTDGRFRRF